MSKKIAFAVVVLMSCSAFSFAHEHMPAQAHSKELERIKQLAGTWSGTAVMPDGKSSPIKTEYRVTAGGSAVEERLAIGNPNEEMVDMYSDEGGKLSMTHFCAMGNHPHMLLKESDTGKIKLEMGPTPDIDPVTTMHMHGLELDFPDSDHLVQRWTNSQNGHPGDKVVFNFTRVK